jgi:hypothetical protein
MLICVETDASRDSGAGETVTAPPASAAETFSRAGTQLGDIAGSLNALAEALGLAPAGPERVTSNAISAPSADSSARPAITARGETRRALKL